ncbi:thymidylate synthase [Novosphingobium sp. 9]|uniref:thymidylate synthase n=1 Tax=Novosphingobium sp. 9 TaxID=2025349 RepID=UPI0021B59FC1|nr:thymidylate synthase [Novosphingobium sp. 9]
MTITAKIPLPPVAESPHWEAQYLDLMQRIWETGDERRDRTGVGTRSLFGATIRFDLSGGAMPLLTTKRVYWKTATRELLWFLTGETNIRTLCAQGVEIWTDWPLDRYRRETGEEIERADFSKRIVEDAAFAAQWGDLGPVYGKQWVDWPVFEPVGETTSGEALFRRRSQGINQIAQVIESLRNNPGSRRHIVEGWNVAELDAMALPPCHKTYQFHVADGRLSCILYQRSCDLGLGFAFNMWSLAALTRMIAQQCDLEPGEAVWMGGDVHLYLNHAALVEEQLSRTPGGQPVLSFARRPESIFDYRIEDFEVRDYTPQGHISAPVAV